MKINLKCKTVNNSTFEGKNGLYVSFLFCLARSIVPFLIAYPRMQHSIYFQDSLFQ